MTKRHHSLAKLRNYIATLEQLEANETSAATEPSIDFHEEGTLRDFVDIVKAGQDCISCLECPRAEGEAPNVLR